MSLDRITSLLTRRTGLDPASLGTGGMAHAVRRRMADCGLSDDGQYEQRLAASDEEWQLLVDEVVVRETWFFRDWNPFVFLQRHVRQRWQPAHPGRMLRALSVPCATGEEAYSIAIALLEAGLAGPSFHVDAFDVSRLAIDRCREAKYGSMSFRGGHLELRQRYFVPLENRHRPIEELTARITFRQGNLLAADFAAGESPYDIIFCRNLLIYFDLVARKDASENLYRLLADDGVLFAGHAEMSHALGPRFAPLDEPRAFAYRKVLSLSAAAPASRSAGRVPRAADCPAAVSAPAPVAAKRPEPAAPWPSALADDSPKLLERAVRMADEGELEAAAAICRQLIARDPPLAAAYCLLGVIEEAWGDKLQAENCYNRGLYLDPNHYESLVHLTLLVESRGDAARAAALRARVGRLCQPEENHAG